jgi:hypothetical protein
MAIKNKENSSLHPNPSLGSWACAPLIANANANPGGISMRILVDRFQFQIPNNWQFVIRNANS